MTDNSIPVQIIGIEQSQHDQATALLWVNTFDMYLREAKAKVNLHIRTVLEPSLMCIHNILMIRARTKSCMSAYVSLDLLNI